MSTPPKDKIEKPFHVNAEEDPVAGRISELLRGELENEKIIIIRRKDVPETQESETQWFFSDGQFSVSAHDAIVSLVTAAFGMTDLTDDPVAARRSLCSEFVAAAMRYASHDGNLVEIKEEPPLYMAPPAEA